MQNIAAVILAAGASSRFGSPKQLAQFRGNTFVRRTVDAAREAGCSPIVLVVGSAAAKIGSDVPGAIVVTNRDWRNGIASSIRVGVRYLIDLEFDVRAIVLLVCDQPLLDVAVITNLSALHQQTRKDIIASSYADTLGVPALFARSIFSELLALDGDSGAKKVIFANRDRVAGCPFPAGNIDIDTPADYENLMRES